MRAGLWKALCSSLVVGLFVALGCSSDPGQADGFLVETSAQPLSSLSSGLSQSDMCVDTTPRIADGRFHTCVLLDTGDVECWGCLNGQDWGQCADYAGSDGVAVGAGTYHTCVLKNDGSVECWGCGTGDDGQCAPYLNGDAVGLAVGSSSSCVLTSGGNVDCWGSNANGQAPDYNGGDAAGMEVHWWVGCIRKTDGTVECFGNAQYTTDTYTGSDVAQVAVAPYGACVLTTGGNTDCWGPDIWGAGLDYTGGDAVGISLSGASLEILKDDGTVQHNGTNYADCLAGYAGGNAVAAIAGDQICCYLLSTGNVDCEGGQTYGQADGYAGGNAQDECQAVPPPPPPLTAADLCQDTRSRFAVGYTAACVLETDGNVECWGQDLYGEGADYAGGNAVGLASNWSESHMCVLKSDGNVECWGCGGAKDFGQCDPYNVGDGVGAAAGWRHTCVLKSDGNVVCWGCGSGEDYGQCAPYAGGDAVGIAAGNDHTCVRKSNGDVECWGCGQNDFGQCAGYDSSITGIDAVFVAAGYFLTCFVKSDGNVDCNGLNNGGQAAGYAGGDAVGVKMGQSHACALKSNGNTACWGSNGWTEGEPYTGGDAIAVGASANDQCVLKADGNAECWGGNGTGDYTGGLGQTDCQSAGAPQCATDADCADTDACTEDVCNLPAGTCSNDPIANCCVTNSDCADDDPCNYDYCFFGFCRHGDGTDTTCCYAPPAINPLTLQPWANPAEKQAYADSQCNDGDPCTDPDTCDQDTNQCQWGPVDPDCCKVDSDCTDLNECTFDICINFVCSNPSKGGDCCTVDTDCDDSNVCTSDECIQHNCRNLFDPANCCVDDEWCVINADDFNPCTEEKCVVVDPVTGEKQCYNELLPDCAVTLPYLEGFDGAASFDLAGWGIVDYGAGAAEDHWTLGTSGSLGPDQHVLFVWNPSVLDASSAAHTPKVDASTSPLDAYNTTGSTTLQWKMAYTHSQDATSVTLRVVAVDDGNFDAGSGVFAGQILFEQTLTEDLEYGLFTAFMAANLKASPTLQVAFIVETTNTFALDNFVIDDVVIASGVPNELTRAMWYRCTGVNCDNLNANAELISQADGSIPDMTMTVSQHYRLVTCHKDLDGSTSTWNFYGYPHAFVTGAPLDDPAFMVPVLVNGPSSCWTLEAAAKAQCGWETESRYFCTMDLDPQGLSDHAGFYRVGVTTQDEYHPTKPRHSPYQSTSKATVNVLIDSGYIVWSPRGFTNPSAVAIQASIEANGRVAQIVEDLTLIDDLSPYDGVFAVMGLYGNQHVMTGFEGQTLKDYLDGGGRVYVEGGEFFLLDVDGGSQNWTQLHTALQIEGLADGSAKLDGPLTGMNFLNGRSFDYDQGALYNAWMDELDHITGSGAWEILHNGGANTFATAVAYDSGVYRTIGSSVLFGGITDNGGGTPDQLMQTYLDFLENGRPACGSDDECNDSDFCTDDTCGGGTCTNADKAACCAKRVDPAGTGADGDTWPTAFTDIQTAIDAAAAEVGGWGAPETCDVWVKAGAYSSYTAAPTDTFELKPGVGLYGGFAGTEAARAERDWVTNVTTLDGQNSSYHVLSATGVADVTVDGFLVVMGLANGAAPHDAGGGLYVLNSDITVSNNSFEASTATGNGGGLYFEGATATLNNNTIIGNTADGGAGFFSDNASNVTVANCTFSLNAGQWGGAVRNEGTATITNSILWNDTAPVGPEIYTSGGGTTTVTYSDVQNWAGAGSDGNIDADPLFEDEAGWDWHLTADSPCVDAADGDAAPDTDKDGNDRSNHYGVPDTGTGTPTYADMGAFEFQVVRDAAVTIVSAPTGDVVEGTLVPVDVTVENQGNLPDSFNVTLTDDTAGTTVGILTVSNLAASGSDVLNFNWDTTGASAESHTLTATIAPLTSETDTADNTLSATVSIVAPSHDVAVTNITVADPIAIGNTVNVDVEVKNEGNLTETFDLNLMDFSTSTPIGTETVTALAAGATDTVTFAWDTTVAGLGIHTLQATADWVIGETDTADNTGTQSTELVECILASDCGSGICDSCPGCVYTGFECDLNNECQGLSGVDPDTSEETCVGCGQDWVDTACCGDDASESWTNPGVGNACCYDGSAVDHGDSVASILCYDGLLYDCNDKVPGVGISKSNMDEVGCNFCDGGTDSWTTSVPPSAECVRYVALDGDNSDGLSWATAATTIQAGIDAAYAATSCFDTCEVWVKQGTYTPAVPASPPQPDTALELKYDVHLLGGFQGNETDSFNRDWDAYPTIIDGNDDRRLFFWLGNGAGDTAILDGFVLQNGFSSANGAAIFQVGYQSVLEVNNCTFQGHTANYSPVIGSNTGAMEFTNCRFLDNEATAGDAGAVQVYNTTNTWTFDNCLFHGNKTSHSGGALAIKRSSNTIITNSTFSDNDAGIYGEAIYYENYSTGSLLIRNSILWGNEGTGVALYEWFNDSWTREFDNNDIESWTINDGGTEPNDFGSGNISADPLFTDGANGDFTLQDCSPAIDAGNGDEAPLNDINGDARHDDTGVTDTGIGTTTYTDMGAFEKQTNSTGCT